MRWLAALAAAAGCQAAAAQAPGAAPALALDGVIAPPADWQPLPAVAAAAGTVAGARALAWGDPGRACYAVVLGTRAPTQNPEDALTEFATSATRLGLAGWTVDATGGRGRFTRGDVAGDVRAVALAAGTDAVVVVAACVAGTRDPAGCATRCQPVLASFDAAKVVP